MKCINKCNCLELTENKKTCEISIYTQYRKFPSIRNTGNFLPKCIKSEINYAHCTSLIHLKVWSTCYTTRYNSM